MIDLPEGSVELRRITIVEHLAADGQYLFTEEFESYGNTFTPVQMFGMLEQAKSTVLANILRYWPGIEDDDDD